MENSCSCARQIITLFWIWLIDCILGLAIHLTTGIRFDLGMLLGCVIIGIYIKYEK